MQTKTVQLIAIAAQHAQNGADMQSSAELCLSDARELAAMQRHEAAQYRALRSLCYSVGIMSPVYAQAKAIVSNSQQWVPTQ